MENNLDIQTSIGDVYEAGRKDINFFAAFALPNVCIYKLPLFYQIIWNLLVTAIQAGIGGNTLQRFALGLPRGHAKTTFLKILISWMLAYDRASFILIVCSNGPLAENLLSDIQDIMSSDHMTQVYGDWEAGLITDNADTKKVIYHSRDILLVARGWTAGIRGLNLKFKRPDFIFCDDVQTKANFKSQTEQQTLIEELAGSIFKAVTPIGHRIIVYVGNMYGENCILDQFRKNPVWTSLITGAILEDGQPLWPELFSLEELMESYYHDESLGLALLWFAEVMNDPQASSYALLPEQLPSCKPEQIFDHDGAFITIDPAGFRKTSDDNVIALHYKYDNKGYTAQTVKGILDPMKLVETTLTMALDNNVTLIGVEAVGYQQTLCFWFNFFLQKLSITHITVVELSPHGRSKESRIRQYISELYAENWYIYNPQTRRDFVWQGSMYRSGRKENKDDLLDACAYAIDIRNEFWHLITNLTPKHALDRNKTHVVGYNTPF